MKISILIKPERKDLSEFFLSRDFNLVENEPNILLYCGYSPRELRSLMSSTKADIAIVTKFKPDDNEKFIWIYNDFNTAQELLESISVITNSITMAQEVYARLGIQLAIQQIKRPISSEKKYKNMFAGIISSMHWK
jgi:hypothetical protein